MPPIDNVLPDASSASQGIDAVWPNADALIPEVLAVEPKVAQPGQEKLEENDITFDPETGGVYEQAGPLIRRLCAGNDGHDNLATFGDVNLAVASSLDQLEEGASFNVISWLEQPDGTAPDPLQACEYIALRITRRTGTGGVRLADQIAILHSRERPQRASTVILTEVPEPTIEYYRQQHKMGSPRFYRQDKKSGREHLVFPITAGLPPLFARDVQSRGEKHRRR